MQQKPEVFGFLFAFLVAVTFPKTQAAIRTNERKHLQKPEVSPDLDPESHKRFFEKDYPHDVQPTVSSDHALSQPYPDMQDASAFDKDYVKDENGDDGEWKAQMDYDTLRHKISKEKNDVEEALRGEQREKAKLESARTQEKAAAEKAAAASKKADEARKKTKELETKVERLEGDAGGDGKLGQGGNLGNGTGGRGENSSVVEEAVSKVEKETDELKECKRQLEEARAQLAEVLKEQEAAEKERRERMREEIAAAEAELKDAETAKEAATANEAAAKQESESLKDASERQEADYAEAEHKYEKEKAEADKVETDLNRAQNQLRQSRSANDLHTDAGGSPERAPRSASEKTSLPLVTLSLVLYATMATDPLLH